MRMRAILSVDGGRLHHVRTRSGKALCDRALSPVVGRDLRMHQPYRPAVLTAAARPVAVANVRA